MSVDTIPEFVMFERAIDAAGDESDDAAICRRPENRPQPGRRTLWEGDTDGEGWREKRIRQAQAAEQCLECPVLGACRLWLADIDRNGLAVDGVVAGEVRRWRRRRKPGTKPA